MEDKLQAELSICIYSEQGLEALMRGVGTGAIVDDRVQLHPGSPHSQAACAIFGCVVLSTNHTL